MLPPGQANGCDSQIHSPVRERLTGTTWQFVRGEGPFSEGYKYDFFEDGTFIRRIISDYADERRGNWIEKPISNDDGLLFLLWQDNSESVLYFSMAGRTMRLSGELLQPVKRSGETSAGSRKPVLINQENFPKYFSITSRSWQKINGADNDFIPDRYTFNRNGAFVASYRSGQCKHAGHWSMTADSIVFEVPSNPCDRRGTRDNFNWTQTFKIENDRLTLDRYIYASSDR